MEILEFWQTVNTVNTTISEQLMPLIAKKQPLAAEYLPLTPLIKLRLLTNGNF